MNAPHIHCSGPVRPAASRLSCSPRWRSRTVRRWARCFLLRSRLWTQYPLRPMTVLPYPAGWCLTGGLRLGHHRNCSASPNLPQRTGRRRPPPKWADRSVSIAARRWTGLLAGSVDPISTAPADAAPRRTEPVGETSHSLPSRNKPPDQGARQQRDADHRLTPDPVPLQSPFRSTPACCGTNRSARAAAAATYVSVYRPSTGRRPRHCRGDDHFGVVKFDVKADCAAVEAGGQGGCGFHILAQHRRCSAAPVGAHPPGERPTISRTGDRDHIGNIGDMYLDVPTRRGTGLPRIISIPGRRRIHDQQR